MQRLALGQGNTLTHKKQQVYHSAALPFTLKKYLKAKEEL